MNIISIQEEKIKGFRKPTDIEKKEYSKYIKEHLDNKSLVEALKLMAFVVVMIAIIIVAVLFAVIAVKFQEVAIVLATFIGAMLAIIIKQSLIVKKLNKSKDELKNNSFELADCIGEVTVSGDRIKIKNIDGTTCKTIVSINDDRHYKEGDTINIIVLAIKKSEFYIIIDRDSIKR